MPITKFKNSDDARDALWRDPGDPEIQRSIAWVWAFSERLFQFRSKPGVRRFHRIEEAQNDRHPSPMMEKSFWTGLIGYGR